MYISIHEHAIPRSLSAKFLLGIPQAQPQLVYFRSHGATRGRLSTPSRSPLDHGEVHRLHLVLCHVFFKVNKWCRPIERGRESVRWRDVDRLCCVSVCEREERCACVVVVVFAD